MSSNFNGKAIIVSAPSGAGKTTLVRHLLNVRSDISFSVSATNRPKRENEKHEVDYYFLSDETFKQKIKKGEFLEWEEVYEGRYYGTLSKEINRIWGQEKHVVFDVDVIGGLHLKKKLKEKALAIFISPGDVKTLEDRLRKRETEEEKEIETRINKAAEEMQKASQFDIILVNKMLDKAKEEMEELVTKFLANA